MDFEPDIVVASPDDLAPHLVIEVKIGAADERQAEKALKRYMARVRSTTGILVTRNNVSVYRETFRSYSDDSIQEVGRIPTSNIPELQRFAMGVSADPLDFEDAVQSWLVQLRNRFVHGFARGVDPIFAEHVVPALMMGEIRAAGPRSTRRRK